jgi:hypothetical protein
MVVMIADQLRKIGCKSTYFDFAGLCTVDGQPVKDFNDLVNVNSGQIDELKGLFE